MSSLSEDCGRVCTVSPTTFVPGVLTPHGVPEVVACDRISFLIKGRISTHGIHSEQTRLSSPRSVLLHLVCF